MLRKKKKGFTLVELIVVLVILGILAALLIPALTGYLDSAKETEAIAKCRQVVTATQSIAAQSYSEGAFSNSLMISKKNEIMKLSEENGTIKLLSFEIDTAKLRKLYYDTGEVVVKYDANAKKKYTINKFSDFLDEVANIGSEAADIVWQNNNNKNRESQIAQYLKDNGSFQEVGADILEKIDYTKKDPLYWKPYSLLDDNKEIKGTILFANSSAVNHGQWKAQVVYVNGKYYQDSTGDKNIAEIYNAKSYDGAEKWLEDNGFSLVE